MTSERIEGIKGFCGHGITVKRWKNGTSLKCEKGKLKTSVIIYKWLAYPEEHIHSLCCNCPEAEKKT